MHLSTQAVVNGPECAAQPCCRRHVARVMRRRQVESFGKRKSLSMQLLVTIESNRRREADLGQRLARPIRIVMARPELDVVVVARQPSNTRVQSPAAKRSPPGTGRRESLPNRPKQTHLRAATLVHHRPLPRR